MTVRDEQTARRIDFAFQQLLKHRPCSRVTAELAEREGISIRTASNYTRQAFEQLRETLEHVERRDLAARCIAALEETIELGLATGQLPAVVGAIRQLDALVCLSVRNTESRVQGNWSRPG